jgi:hypothetical protein
MKKLLIGLALLLGFGMVTPVMTMQNVALADTKTAICEGVGATGADCATGGTQTDVNKLVATIINIFSWIVGVVAVIMVIFGGFRYITSGGDSNKVSSAKNTILYALIGLIIVALAQAIVIFVLNTATPPPTP